MGKQKKHTLHDALQYIDKAKLPGKVRHEDSWAEFQQKLDKSQTKPNKLTKHWVVRAAAVLLICIGLSALWVRGAQQEIVCQRGEQLEHQLPDGSTVFLNAESRLAYNSALWIFSRTLRFEGEAYFEVKKGDRFTVQSQHGNTHVLGTSFTVLARNELYRVQCHTGKVAVQSGTSQQEILLPFDEVTFQGKQKTRSVFDENEAVSAWRQGGFNFEHTNLHFVFEELARRYNYTIHGDYPETALYSGFFQQHPIQESMQMVCLPFGLGFKLDSIKREIDVYPLAK